jgi:hypothetical protein
MTEEAGGGSTGWKLEVEGRVTTMSKEDLRQVQGDYPQGCSASNLRERKAQAAPGLSEPGNRSILRK